MNKKLIAMAVAAGLMAPMAASHAAATWYGQLQAEISSESSDASLSGANFDGHVVENSGRLKEDGTSVQDNKRGRLGVKGSEDLGGGLKAIYKFEFQVSTINANVDDGDRNAFVGLKGGFGTIKIGALKTPYKYFGGVKYDPFVTTNIEARRYGGMTRGSFGQNSFFTNSVGYENKIGNGKLWIVYRPDEVTAGADADYSLGYKLKGGNNWEAFVATSHDDDLDNDPTTIDYQYDAVKVGGKVKLGAGTLVGQYETTTNETAAGDEDGTVIFLGYHMKMGKNTFVIQAADASVEYPTAGTPDQDSTYYALGVVHKFSKKTRAFVGYGSTSIDNADGASGVNGDRTAFTAGLRIDF